MQTFEYVIKDEHGIHARPAGQLVAKAKGFTSQVTISLGPKSADLKALFKVMGLGVKQGNTVKVTVEGADEAVAAKALEAFMGEHF
jgi:phosphocarrier protein